MTVRNGSLLTAGFVAAFAIGVLTGPTIRDNWSRVNTPTSTVASPAGGQHAATPAKGERPVSRARSSSPRANEVVATKRPSNTAPTTAVSQWDPEVRDRVKAVLNRGARLEIAADNFDSAEQFVTVAHAAHDTKIPFMVLKDRVLNQGQSLTEAIHEFKPELDARAEVTRARAAARSDLGIAS